MAEGNEPQPFDKKIARGSGLTEYVDSHYCKKTIDYSGANFSNTPSISLTPNIPADTLNDAYIAGYKYGMNSTQCEAWVYSVNGLFTQGNRAWLNWIAIGN